jgi:hypothetical protein
MTMKTALWIASNMTMKTPPQLSRGVTCGCNIDGFHFFAVAELPRWMFIGAQDWLELLVHGLFPVGN